MEIYYSANTGGFYNDRFHPAIPEDAVKISAAEHRALLAGQSAGQIISIDATGRPVLAERPAPTTEQLAAAARTERDRRLHADVDTINAIRWAAMTEAEQSAWRNYRQALLDVPQQPGFPEAIDWPQPPAV